MAAVITELDNFQESVFYDNRTWLNQENWQMYFGGSLPSGVIVDGSLTADGQWYSNALTNYNVNSSYKEFRSGKIIANGIFGSYEMGTYIPALTSSQVDRLIVARVYQLAGLVKIVGKTKIASDQGYTPAAFAKMLLQDESVGCVRDETFYEIPLMYEIYGSHSYDLRRLYYLPGNIPALKIDYLATGVSTPDAGRLYGLGWVQVYGGMAYDIEISEEDASTSLYIYPNPACSDKPTVIYIKNNSSVNKDIRLPLSWKSLNFKYEWIDNWDGDDQSTYKYKELVANDKMVLILTPFSVDNAFGYTVTSKGMVEGFDPSDYYTKQEETVLLAAKASYTYVDTELAKKANTSSLGTLATKNAVSYTTEVTNKPTLGALAAKDSANLTTDVTGILPIENGGTGANSLGGIVQQIIDGTTTIYVNYSTGSDATGDGTSSNPYKTIQKGIDSALPTNAVTIMVLPGEYVECITVSGKNITIKGTSNSEIKIGKLATGSVSAVDVNEGGQLHLIGKFTIQEGGSYNCHVWSGGKLIYDTISNSDTLTLVWSSRTNENLCVENGGIFSAQAGKTVYFTGAQTASSYSGCIAILAKTGGIVMLPTIQVYDSYVYSCQGGVIICNSISAGSTYSNRRRSSSESGLIVEGMHDLT